MARYGSLINQFAGNKSDLIPVVGMGVTECGWTDRHAGTITRVSPSGKTLWFTYDTATRVDKNGMSESQQYAYTSNPTAPAKRAVLTKRGWKVTGAGKLLLNVRMEYYDYSF